MNNIDNLVLKESTNKYEETRKRIDELSKPSEEVVLNTIDDELVDEDIIEIISTNQYANGKPIISKMEFKYKENKLPDESKKLENIKLC